jgi:epsilon-lactone hydrolase
VIFYINGGGFVRGNGIYTKGCALVLYKNLELPVVACEYRTAPTNRYPAGLDDAHAAYDFMVNELGIKPENIIIASDSAGGYFSMALTLRLKEKRAQLPAGLFLISPACDITLQGDSHRTNIGIDIYFPKGIAGAGTIYAEEKDFAKPGISPIYGDFAGFPLTYFCVGDAEVFLSDSLMAAEKLAKNDINTLCHVFPGLWHLFPLITTEMPESQEVYADVKEFFKL